MKRWKKTRPRRKTRRSPDLATPLLLHSLGNLAVLAKDFVLLQYPEWVVPIVGYPPG